MKSVNVRRNSVASAEKVTVIFGVNKTTQPRSRLSRSPMSAACHGGTLSISSHSPGEDLKIRYLERVV